jgi:hypothetical protein
MITSFLLLLFGSEFDDGFFLLLDCDILESKKKTRNR